MDDDESPPRKRARMLSKACEMCKIKKSRCDSARPCSLCRQKGTKCEYREKGQPGLRPGYGKAMESRMAVLEDSMLKMSENLQQVLQQLQRGQIPTAMSAIPKISPMPQIAQAMSGSGSEHGSLGDDTPEDSTAGDHSMQPSIAVLGTNTSNSNVALSSLPPPPLWQPVTTPSGEWLSLSPAVAHKIAPEMLASVASAKPVPAAPPIDKMPADTGIMTEPTTSLSNLPGLPPREILHELIEVFFDRIYPWAPLFYRPNFIHNLSTATFTDTTNSINTIGNEKLLLLHGITVLCFRYWKKPTPTPEAREAFISASRDQVLLRTIDACSLVSTQALTLLAIDAVGQGPGPRTWNIMAMLVAAARQLILATRTPNRPRDEANTPFVNDEGDDEEGVEVEGGSAEVDEARRRQHAATEAGNNKGTTADQSAIEAEEKRRLFWVIYSLDRFASIFHGQPGAIDTKTIRLLYPSSDEEWGRPSASPEWFQGTSDNSSGGGQGGSIDANGGGVINFNYANLSSSNPNANGGSSNSPGNLGNSSSNHANCSANLWHHYIDALTLVDRSHQLLIQPVNVSISAHCQEWQCSFRRFDSVLTAWFDNLPAFVREGLPISGQQSSSAVSSAASATSASPAATLHTPSFSPVRVMIYASYLLIFVRMYMIASFPATTSAYLRPSMAARSRLRQVCHDLANLASMYQPHELQALGPIFVFIVWVGARSLVILWTRGGYSLDELCPAVHKSTSAASSSSSEACMLPPDLETILTSLRHMAVRWPCAQRYVDIIQMIIDTKNSPGGPPGIDIFNDPRRTSYVIQSRFQALANGRRASMSRAKSHDSAGSPERKATAGLLQSQNHNQHQNRQQHSHTFSPFTQYGSNQNSNSSLRGSQNASIQPHSYSQTQHPYQANPEPMMPMPFSQSLDFFDIPLLDSFDFTGTLIGTGTFGTEIDSEWL